MKTSEASEGARTLRTSELLRKAADEIRRRGWWQGDFAQPNEGVEGWYENCPVCLWGAVNAAMQDGDPFQLNPATAKVAGLAAEAGGGFPDDIAAWNDDPDRTVEEVLDAFEKAAVTAEAVGD